ncbi:MAG: hypothetical protein IPJ03_16390, partial [Ignavibacteriales bacterium]|nr:hypothetical protein [Ignavibacteriales bacterium]
MLQIAWDKLVPRDKINEFGEKILSIKEKGNDFQKRVSEIILEYQEKNKAPNLPKQTTEKQPYERSFKEHIEYNYNKPLSEGKEPSNHSFERIKETIGESGINLEKGIHKKLVQQAINEGKIDSHPDYPE